MPQLTKPAGVTNLVGRVFGRWTVVACAGKVARKHVKWQCRCECGNVKFVYADNLTGGRSLSCGCLRKEVVAVTSLRHGYARVGRRTVEYQVWEKMIHRCTNPNSPCWKYYGGKGVTVCDRWRDFVNFLEDVGERPSPRYSLERLRNSEGYGPGNVVWADRLTQANNKSNNRRVEYLGETLSVAQWSRRCGIPYFTLMYRLKAGWDVAQALTEPVRQLTS